MYKILLVRWFRLAPATATRCGQIIFHCDCVTFNDCLYR